MTETEIESKIILIPHSQVIAIGIALREDEDETLHKTKAVCDGVTGLQLLYGAVVYRAQHTIHHVLGDLSMTKQLSREISTPVTPYTSNNLIEVISSSTGLVVADDTDSAASGVDVSRDTGEAVRSGNGPDDKTNSVAEDSSSIVAREPGYSNPDQKPSDSNPITNQKLNEPIKQPEGSSSPNTDTGRSGNAPDLSSLVLQTSQESVDTPTESVDTPTDSVDTPTDSADGGVTTDETYSTDISEIFRAVYPGIEEIGFLSDDEDDTDDDFTNVTDETTNRTDNNNTTGGNNQEFFIRFNIKTITLKSLNKCFFI